MSNEIFNIVFDGEMQKSIMEFAQTLSNVTADFFVVMSRKAACFIRFLERHGYISLDGEVVTDRILDIDIEQFKDKSIAIIDDVVVSGTTIFSIIKRLQLAQVCSIKAYILGVNEQFYSKDLFEYTDSDGTIRNYIQSPYILLSDAACMRVCSNIVSTFALDISPYDVDFPKHEYVTISEKRFEQILAYPDWFSYDVSSDLQAEYDIKNITLLPTKRVEKLFDNSIGISISQLGFCKIRLYAKYNSKKQQYTVNAVPYFLFNEIMADDIDAIFSEWFQDTIDNSISRIAKIRILQYIIAEKLFMIWNASINRIFEKQQSWEIDKVAFCSIFPKSIYLDVIDVINSSKQLTTNIVTLSHKQSIKYHETTFVSSITLSEDQEDNIAVLQTKLIEPFTSLYFTKEKESRELVLKYGKKAFDIPEYKRIIERLKHGYSYHMLINLVDSFPNIFDKITTVSLFIDEAIDAGIIVPIIAEETSDELGKIYFRAYRHGEDVPFGELQEKLCATLLKHYAQMGGEQILSNLRVEKMLVLFVRIGIKQGIFRPSPQDGIYYNVNIDSYLHGNITTVQDTSSKRPFHYLKHRTDAMWLTEVLQDKGIIKTDKGRIIAIDDNIDIPIDPDTRGKVAAIGKTFAKLHNNSKTKTAPFITDDDLVLLSTCMLQQDILNALAAEIAIFSERWGKCSKEIRKHLDATPSKVIDLITKGEIYTSINSGQAKFFNFMEKKAQKRIDEISEELRMDEELSIYGTLWDQFWSDNRNWSHDSINKQIYNTILSEGKCLIIFNLLCRLLFYCSTDINDTEGLKKWKEQTIEYQKKLQHPIFSKFKDLGNLIEYSEHLIGNEGDFQTPKVQERVNICQLISKNVTLASPILSDVELLVDRHGKPCSIKRYVHAVYVRVSESRFAVVNSAFDSYFGSREMEFQVYPIGQPTLTLPEAGIWFFIKGGKIEDIKQIIYKFANKFAKEFAIECIKVYFDLSESLRLKISSACNTKARWGSFPTYSSSFTQYSLHEQISCPVYWILEDSKANSIVLKELCENRHNILRVIDKYSHNIETTASSTSVVLVTEIKSAYERYRKEYCNMSNKCTLFISYSEDSVDHVAKVQLIADRLKEEGFNVRLFADMPLGTDMVRFMREIESSDITLIIGSPEYKNRAYSKDDSGVSFEDRILADVFMSESREKIVPISFGDFETSIPAPFNKLKGMHIGGPTHEELTTLAAALMRKYTHMKKTLDQDDNAY